MSELSVSWGSRRLASCIYQIVHEHDKAFRSCFVGPFSRKRVCFHLLSLYDRNDVQLDSLSLLPNWLPKNPLWCFGFDILEVSSQCFGWNWQGWNLGNCVSDHQEDQEGNTDEFPLSTRRDMLTSRRRERELIHFMMLAIINIYVRTELHNIIAYILALIYNFFVDFLPSFTVPTPSFQSSGFSREFAKISAKRTCFLGKFQCRQLPVALGTGQPWVFQSYCNDCVSDLPKLQCDKYLILAVCTCHLTSLLLKVTFSGLLHLLLPKLHFAKVNVSQIFAIETGQPSLFKSNSVSQLPTSAFGTG